MEIDNNQDPRNDKSEDTAQYAGGMIQGSVQWHHAGLGRERGDGGVHKGYYGVLEHMGVHRSM